MAASSRAAEQPILFDLGTGARYFGATQAATLPFKLAPRMTALALRLALHTVTV